MSELLLSADALVVPSCVKGKALTFDMRKIHRAEARLVELQGVTKAKAGELFHCFIEAFGEAKSHLAQLRGEYGRAKQKTRSIRGLVLLDRAPDVLKKRGITKTSEDLRDGVVNNDPEYEAVFDQFTQVEAALEFMEGKVEKLKMAYYATSDLIKGADISRRDTTGGTGDDEPGVPTQSETLRQFVEQHTNVDRAGYEAAGFGVPKY